MLMRNLLPADRRLAEREERGVLAGRRARGHRHPATG